MSWITEHKKFWRAVILVVAVVAMMGPWNYEQVSVPSEFECSESNIRLDEDFCGVPLTGMFILRMMVSAFVYASVGLVTGNIALGEWARGLLFSLPLVLLVLPLFCTLLLILRGDRRRWQVVNIAAWALVAGMCLLLLISYYPELFWINWGLWTYIGLAVIALILEALTLRRQGRVVASVGAVHAT